MAIIDPEGLFCGERLANCSDMAQLCWPRFFLAANSCAHLELSYKSLVSRVFGNFQKVLESEEIWRIFREYEANFLAVLYEAPDGGWWCQFITSEKYLPKYKKTRDNMTPAPTFEQMEESRNGYLQWKRSKSISNQSFQKVSESFVWDRGRDRGRDRQIQKPCRDERDSTPEAALTDAPPQAVNGYAPAISVGGFLPPEPEPPAPEPAPAAKRKPGRAKSDQPTRTAIAKQRHADFKAAIGEYWKSKNPDVAMPWDGAEGQNLDLWLRASSQTSIEQFTGYLRNRFRSDVNHAERPCSWIRNITRYAAGPLDRFGQPLQSHHGKPDAADPLAKMRFVNSGGAR
jgi:hypothetical protein